MITSYLYALLGVAGVGFVSLVGVFFISVNERVVKRYIPLLVSLAVGALLGDAFIHLIPEAFEGSENSLAVSLCIVAGIVLFFALEKFMHWHHHGDDTEHGIHALASSFR